MDPNAQTADQADEHQSNEGEASGPKLVQMPRAASELRYGKGKMIKPGTVITDQIATSAGLNSEMLDRLEASGAIVFVDVYVG